MYKVSLYNKENKRTHEVAGEPVVIYTDRLEYTVEQLMRNRDPRLYSINIERF
jgi:hypothetical protein